MAVAIPTDTPATAPPRPDRLAWVTFTMVFIMMVIDYVDRQIIVAMFPALKAEFGWSDTQLGGLVSVVSLTVAFGALPIAIIVDRWSRTRGIMVMGAVWSLATISCGFAANYAQLFLARFVVGAGEAGYGPAGGALLAARFPTRLHATVLGAFQAAAGIGSIIGVVLGGYLAAQYGWRMAFGIVGVPGLILALMFWFLPDYRTVKIRPEGQADAARTGIAKIMVATFREFRAKPTALLVSIGGAMQLALAATMTTWLPSFFARAYELPQQQAGAKTALVLLAFSIGAVVWGRVVDRAGEASPTRKLPTMAVLSLASGAAVGISFGLMPVGTAQTAGIILAGALMGCTLGSVLALVLDVIDPAFRATAAAVVALVGNLGMAIGPFVMGIFSDAWGLASALALAPFWTVLAATLFMLARPVYAADRKRAAERLRAAGGAAA
ncbi:MAG: MFS transporter [Pararhodobacter sp.]